jgi:4-hydroxy-3-polyprenylbenzoate decarboxylase
MQVFNRNSTGMHWHMHKTGARHYQAYKDLNRLMPVAVALGGDPVYSYCATAPLPDGVDEYLLAGFIRNKAVRMVKCITQDVWVPEDCDFVLEGFVDPSESLTTEGPFGDHTGFYSLEDQFPVFHLTAITRRQDAVYPATIVGIPPQEDSWLAHATERMFLPLIRFAMVPEMIDFHMPFEGVAHNLVLTKIKSNYPGQGRKVLHTLWGAGQMMFTKFSVIVSSDGPLLTEYGELIRHISNRVDPSKHIEIASGPLDILDHSSRIPAFGGKLGIDSTGPELLFSHPSPTIIEERQLMTFLSANPSITDINLEWVAKGVSLGIISLRKTYPGAVKDLQDEIRLADGLNKIRFWILFDDGVNIRRDEEVVWLACSNTEITSDVRIFAPTNGLNMGLLFIDATVKTFDLDGFNRPWPNLTLMNPETIRLVDQRWGEYQIGSFLPSRSIQYQANYFPGAVRHDPPKSSQ